MSAVATPRAAWVPQAGSQALFLACPYFECLYEGTRGPGKSDALLMDFAQHVGQGYGAAWRGVIFRKTYKQLDEVVAKSKRWFRRIFPGAQFKESQAAYRWVWPGGEELAFRHFRGPKDYEDYHGHELPWIGWEELTTWPDLVGYHMMKAVCRSSHPDVPRKYRANTNPWGVGHNPVKAYFIDPAPPGVPVQDEEGLWRVRIRGHWSENQVLLRAQPDYPKVIAAAAKNPEQRKAWLKGDWDIVAGGMLDDLWDRAVHVLARFPIPAGWRVDRAYDWGSSKPFSVGWWAESDGTPAVLAGTTRTFPRGTLFRIAEWYGWNGRPNEGLGLTDAAIAKGIIEREKALGIRDRVRPGPADSTIFDTSPGHTSIADTMRSLGVSFVAADKKPGSRKNGWAAIRERLEAGRSWPMERPGLFVFDTCTDGFIRTVPVLPRDEKDPDDVDTDAEDHVGDETRYRILTERREVTVTRIRT